ncbi:MAG: 3-methyl-2-oxobutanoate hydroxymethyltransferase [Bdellovibrionales bacterium]|nr:3-methyl-2-oxobutanoate hydroxymethyltransferase [Bdellovibrionales bacterium]
MSVQGPLPTLRNTVKTIQAMRDRGEKIAMLTAYDAITASLVETSGTDLILVGDSVGNTLLGYDTTVPVTLSDMIHHTRAVVRGTHKALVVMDLPFGTTTTSTRALNSSAKALQESGCQAVKLEGGTRVAKTVEKLVQAGIPVMGHIGLEPQSVNALGGYGKKGKTSDEAKALIQSAKDLQNAGAFSLVLELVIPEIAAEITETLKIPTIGIGSGNDCSGQVLVINDLIGLSVRPIPKFAKPRADVASTIRQAVQAYVQSVRRGES